MTPSEPGSLLLQPFPNFHSAASAALKFLQDHLGFDLCMVTRVKDNQWIAVNVEDRRYGIKPGAVFPWQDTLCYSMVTGHPGQQIIPEVSAVAAYAQAPLTQQFNIAAYISLPLFHSDGSLFGTLCAFHPEAKPSSIKAQQPLLRLLVQLLVSLLDSDLKLLQQKRQLDRNQAQAWQDKLTGLYKKPAWLHFITIEDSRCHRYGREAGVISLEIHGETSQASQAQEWFQSMAQVLRTVLREEDIMARVNEREIAIIAVETGPEPLERLLERIKSELRLTAFSIAYGAAVRLPSSSLTEAWHTAQGNLRQWKT